MKEHRRVAVTGMGVVTPLGCDLDSFWGALCACRSAVGPITAFDASALNTQIAAEVHGFVPPPEILPRTLKQMDRFAQFGLAAALQAWGQSGLGSSAFDPDRAGVLIGSSHGGEVSAWRQMEVLASPSGHGVSPWTIPHLLTNMASAQTAIHLGLHGPSFTLGSACATGAQAIGEAAAIIRRGDADKVRVVANDDVAGEACVVSLQVQGTDADLGQINRADEERSLGQVHCGIDGDGAGRQGDGAGESCGVAGDDQGAVIQEARS